MTPGDQESPAVPPSQPGAPGAAIGDGGVCTSLACCFEFLEIGGGVEQREGRPRERGNGRVVLWSLTSARLAPCWGPACHIEQDVRTGPSLAEFKKKCLSRDVSSVFAQVFPPAAQPRTRTW